MIQRIQTVYLFLGAVALTGLFFFDSLWSSTAAASIFLYENRQTQRTVVVGAQLLTVAVAAVLYGGLYLTGELAVRAADGFDWAKAGMLGLPILAYLLFLLARRGIDHDIELVKSMDRLR